LYEKVYAPYSKWFGKAFTMLNNSKKLKEIFEEALHALDINVRENKIVEAQKIVADLHNESNISKQVKIEIEKYYGRDIKVIHPEKFAEAIAEELINTEIGRLPLIGTFSSIGGLSSFSDEKEYYGKIKKLYEC